MPAVTERLVRSLTLSSAMKGGGKVSPEEDYFHEKSTKYDEVLSAAASSAADENEPAGKAIPVGGLDRDAGSLAIASVRVPEAPAAALPSGISELQRPTVSANVVAPYPEAATLVTVDPTDHMTLK